MTAGSYGFDIKVYNKEDLHQLLDMLELIFHSNPLILSTFSKQISNLSHSFTHFNEKFHMALSDQLRVANLYMLGAYKPTFFFAEMLRNTDEGFEGVEVD